MNGEKKYTLLILAGGLGTRFKSKKQTASVGPNGEFLLEYAVYNAVQAGFKEILFIVNDQLSTVLKEKFNWLSGKIALGFINQSEKSPDYPINRKKPWGTGHAVAIAKCKINAPFLVINADDYYGIKTYILAYELLSSGYISQNNMGMIAFQLKNTLSENGPVSRGVCKIDKKGFLKTVTEHKNIEYCEKKICSNNIEMGQQSLVSMNCWILHPEILNILNADFHEFYRQNKHNQKAEFYLPDAIQKQVSKGLKIKVLVSNQEWMGLTYTKDRLHVSDKLSELTVKGNYPNPLKL